MDTVMNSITPARNVTTILGKAIVPIFHHGLPLHHGPPVRREAPLRGGATSARGSHSAGTHPGRPRPGSAHFGSPCGRSARAASRAQSYASPGKMGGTLPLGREMGT